MPPNTNSLALSQANRRLRSRSFESYLTLLRKLCRSHPSEETSTLVTLLDNQDWDGVLTWSDSILSPQSYGDAHTYYVRSQFTALIKKYPWEKLVKANPRASAVAKFWSAEHKCKRINQRFKARNNAVVRRRQLPWIAEIDRMRKFITYVVGDIPDTSKIFSLSGFGPGASVGVHGSATNVARKLLCDSWTVTPSAMIHSYCAIMEHAQFREVLIPEHGGFTSGTGDFSLERERFRDKVRMVKHNKIVFVPKTAKVHRTIAIEPLLNSFLQKGVDLYFRERLRRIGIDLTDQGANSEFAREGSLPGVVDPFVTIDLASASDSISRMLVAEVFPPEWYALLNAYRSSEFELDGAIYSYHKFCSMGNGFCFPLETLVFVAACHAVGAGKPGVDFLVYGDDIVVRQSVAGEVIKFLDYLGFKTNSEKTFLEGPFRESCGTDWYEGMDVRPTTLDFALDSIENVIKFLNLSRRSDRTTLFFSEVRSFLFELIPGRFRYCRPFTGNADTAIDCDMDEFLASPHSRWNRELWCWSWKEFSHTSVPDIWFRSQDTGHVALLWGALSGTASDAPFSHRRKRRTKTRYVTGSGATSLWVPAP